MKERADWLELNKEVNEEGNADFSVEWNAG